MKLTPSRKCPHFRQNRCRMRRPPPRKRQPKSTAGTRRPRAEGDEHRRVDEREIPDFRLMPLRPLSDMNDLKIAFRQLLKHPGFTAIVLLTLALGVGAVSAVFSLVRGVLLTPPPYFKPEQIVLISSVRTTGEPYAKGCTAAQWQEWRTEAKSFREMAGYCWTLNFLLSPDGSESVPGLMVTRDFFKVIGIQPQIGRFFLPSDIPPSNAQQTVVILGT